MKQTILLAALLVSFCAYSQQATTVSLDRQLETVQFNLNEVKLNLATTIFGSYPEITYERILDSDMSVGASVGVGLNDDYILDFAFIPYFRWFFGGSHASMQKYGAGLYLEANGALFSGDEDSSYGYPESSGSQTGAGLGIAIGWKYLTKNNWVGDFYMGAGRDFANDGAYPRVGISIGKRF